MKILIALATLSFAVALPLRANLFPAFDAASERATARADREQSLYDDGTEALDDHDYHRAAAIFREVSALHGAHADAARYWQAYAESRMAMRAEALAHIAELRAEFPRSKWNEDATALEVEIRQAAGEAIPPERVHDDELRLMAVSGLMDSDPQKAIPMVVEILQSKEPEKVKDRALFVLAQSGSPQAREILVRTAKSPTDKLLRTHAIRYIGIMGGDANKTALADIYKSVPDLEVRRSILRAFMTSGDRGRLLALAKTEPREDLRGDAIAQLAMIGARNELAQLYANEQSLTVRKKILDSMLMGGSADRVAEIARSEKNVELKRTAIRNLGLLGGGKSGPLLTSIYDGDTRPEVRLTVIDALFLQGNFSSLRAIQAKETNPELKRSIDSKLALMGR